MKGCAPCCASRPAGTTGSGNADLTMQIAAAHAASRGTYGAPRLFVELREAGTHTSKRAVPG